MPQDVSRHVTKPSVTLHQLVQNTPDFAKRKQALTRSEFCEFYNKLTIKHEKRQAVSILPFSTPKRPIFRSKKVPIENAEVEAG